jgi:hypothetical protein
VPDSLPAALFQHAALRPEEPWLFSRQGWDWPWLPFRTVAGRVAAWSAELAGLPAGCRAAFAAWPGPQSIALDLALQAAGLLSIPLKASNSAFADALASRDAEIWIEPAGSEPRELPAGLPRLALSAWTEEGPSGLGGAGPPASPYLHLPPGGVVLDGGRQLAAADLVVAAAALEALLAPQPRARHWLRWVPRTGDWLREAPEGAGPQDQTEPAPRARRGREILVSFRPLGDPAERQLLAWATWTGAALLLEADRSAGPASAVWARPTLFHGDPEDVAVLRRAADRRHLFRPRLPFGRLHTILVDGDLPAGDRAFWEGRGVRLVAILPI